MSGDLVARDRRHVWHPYASVVDHAPLWPVVDAHGTRLVLDDGRELVDGMSSWWAAIHGSATRCWTPLCTRRSTASRT